MANAPRNEKEKLGLREKRLDRRQLNDHDALSI